MGKFNKSNVGVNSKTDVKNVAGFDSFSRTDKKGEVASVILNSMLNGDSFYETEGDRIKNIESFLSGESEDFNLFFAKAMVYTRNEGNLRSVSHLMGTLLAENVKGTSFLKPALIASIVRVDDMAEMLSLWNMRNPGKMVPNSMRKAFKYCLEHKFDKYQFKKYENKRSKVKLRDVVKIAHPDPKVWSEIFE